MTGNPESMRPTQASKALPVIEANEIVFQAARTIIQQESRKSFVTRDGNVLFRARKFIGAL